MKKIKLLLSIQASWSDTTSFIAHWQTKYSDPRNDETLYTENIGKPPTGDTRERLFQWKNGSRLSAEKQKSIVENYPSNFTGSITERYLTAGQNGGPIWNIFYAHVLNRTTYPIFDQHTYRAMIYLTGQMPANFNDFEELEKKKAEHIYSLYLNMYIPFYNSIDYESHDDKFNRHKDQALFAFGKFLKTALRYL